MGNSSVVSEFINRKLTPPKAPDEAKALLHLVRVEIAREFILEFRKEIVD